MENFKLKTAEDFGKIEKGLLGVLKQSIREALHNTSLNLKGIDWFSSKSKESQKEKFKNAA